ncbi:MAG: hypothetical protein R2757_20865 [Draconibacterium sp.]
MNLRLLSAFVFTILILFSCNAPKTLVSSKINAENAFTAGNYAKAMKDWEQYFSETTIEQVTGADFATAAKIAYMGENSLQAITWFDQARYKSYSDFEMYITLAEIYRKQKNISKELTALEYIKNNYSEKSSLINNRLFQIYDEIGLIDKAINVWGELDAESKNDFQNLISYFEIQKQLKDSIVCDSLALIILDKDQKQVDALEWMAIKYYWMGEKRYQREMEIYNENKTTRQYRILLEELNKSTADFKTSLGYLEKLWNLEPGKKYASYFANIYARFGDEQKANYYEKYLE